MNCELEEVVESSQENSDVIRPINRETVHRICSGQVVLSLAIAVKELVENAIDADATIVDIRLKEYGSELIEVSDNGTGVKEENFQTLTLKHYTSKIRQFDDLGSLATLGFRGEALSSLCALSDLSVLTKHQDAGNAAKITYDRTGKITSENVGARERGTTVILENLFSTLPVRRREFVKNLKREFNKMCQLLYAYCLACKGVKFSCVNVTNRGSKSTVVSTEGLTTVKENIINVFGPKQISSLIEVEMVRPEEPVLGEYGVQLAEGEPLPFLCEFFISSVMHGSGRSTSDRQFFYINSRPCELAKVTKLINETYKQYNNSQYPFVYLNIQTDSCLVDVNVTPDKRQIFLEKEKVLLATIKSSLVEAFKAFPSTYKMQNLELTQSQTIRDFFENTNGPQRGIKRSLTDGAIKKGSIVEKFKKKSKTESDKGKSANPIATEDKDHTLMLDTFLKIASDVTEGSSDDLQMLNETDLKSKEIEKCESKKDRTPFKQRDNAEDSSGDLKVSNEIVLKSEEIGKCELKKDQTPFKQDNLNIKASDTCNKKDSKEMSKDVKKNQMKNENSDKIAPPQDENKIDIKAILNMAKNAMSPSRENILNNDVEILIDTRVKGNSNTKSVTLDVTLDDISESLKSKRERKIIESDIKVRFRSKINPESSKSAEEELRKQISKEDFAKMSVLGQFNLGFIVTKLQNDLFIIDQHATDEKYNFEQLQANTVMENQVLVNPKPLQLTAGNENLLIENQEIFKKNGFTFKIDETVPCTKKVSLTSVPLSKNIIFGKDDINEMLLMLQESNRKICRPSRLTAMFASRACRKSVMIGKALTKSDMRKLVDHMGEIEQPWNCPHGRPTMRHLINLDLIDEENA